MQSLSTVSQSFPRSGIRVIMELAAGLPDVIHLEVGEPDVNTPDEVIEAAFRGAREGHTKYTPNAGTPELRAAIVGKLRRVNGLERTPAQVVVTTGAVAALSNAVLAIVDPGDEVLVPDPGWPNYIAMVRLAGGTAVRYPCPRESGYQPDLAALERLVTPRTKLIMTNSPGNPTGAVFPVELVAELVAIADRHDLYLLADEVYEAFVFDGDHHSAAAHDRDGRVVTVFAFSKTYAMTGWRLGYAVASEEIATLMAKLAEPLVSCPSSIAQKGAEAALQLPDSFVDPMRRSYAARRDLVVDLLGPAGLLASVPQGAFYAMADLRGCGMTSDELARGLISEENVATAPGASFGPSAEGFVRLSLATDPALLEEGCRRIIRFAERRGGTHPVA